MHHTSPIALALNHVSYRYEHEAVLDDVSLEVHAGEFLGLIGPNGSGKTTLIKVILGLLQPSSGTVNLQSTRVGYVPQRAGFDAPRIPITAREVVAMAGGSPAAVTQALKDVGMAEFASSLLFELSGGQQQRVFIARALVAKPDLLILDEPTVGVDAQSQETFYKVLASLHAQHHLTLILVSHDMDAIAKQVTSIACIHHTLVFHGPPHKITNATLRALYGAHMGLVGHHHNHGGAHE